jgi:hypothetical protein
MIFLNTGNWRISFDLITNRQQIGFGCNISHWLNSYLADVSKYKVS